jgi:hypothetical protein
MKTLFKYGILFLVPLALVTANDPKARTTFARIVLELFRKN